MISHKKFSSCAGGAQAVVDYMLAGEYYMSETDQAEGYVSRRAPDGVSGGAHTQ